MRRAGTVAMGMRVIVVVAVPLRARRMRMDVISERGLGHYGRMLHYNITPVHRWEGTGSSDFRQPPDAPQDFLL
ncbi:hypothetical protein BRAO375_3500007 [Bradyrhizobium sp. ORS 375]|nr:hypothetical protein BRAO375_3500007 [Bradyrhizobium sp. ORS 375]